MISTLAKITPGNANRLQVIGTLAGHTAPILSIDVAPGGQLVASGGMDGTVRVWDLPTQAQVNVFAARPEYEKIPRVAFSPANPDHLAAAVGRKPYWEMPDVGDYVGNLFKDLSPFSDDKPVWRLWSVASGSVIHTEARQFALHGTDSLAYSRDGRWLGATDGIFDLTTDPPRRAARETERYLGDMAFSDDSQLLAMATYYEKHPENITYHFVDIYQVSGWKKIVEIKESRGFSDFSTVRFVPNSHELLVRTSVDTLRDNGSHKLYHLKGTQFENRSHVQDDVACFACDPDADLLAIARYDGRMVLLDWNRNKPVATVQAYHPAKPIWKPRFPFIETAKTHREQDAMKSRYRASAAMAFSQDGKLLISADGDHVIRLWGVPA